MIEIVIMSDEFRSISELKKLLASNCNVEKVYPQVLHQDDRHEPHIYKWRQGIEIFGRH
jgi:hypothetical protein